MQEWLHALGDPVIRDWYLGFCFALLVLPMIALSFWYHRRIEQTAGGQALMKRQRRSAVRPHGSLGDASRSLSDGISIMRDIAFGRYGAAPRMMQNKLFVIIGCWIAANVIAFGILLWADEVNRGTAG